MKHGKLAYRWRDIFGFPKDYYAFLWLVFIAIAQYISGFCRCAAYMLSELTVQIEHKCGRQMIAPAFSWPRTAVLICIQGFCDMSRCPLVDTDISEALTASILRVMWSVRGPRRWRQQDTPKRRWIPIDASYHRRLDSSTQSKSVMREFELLL
jgi:hypothetical protein